MLASLSTSASPHGSGYLVHLTPLVLACAAVVVPGVTAASIIAAGLVLAAG